MISALADGAVKLYHNNANKLETSATGIDVTGTVTADGLTVSGDAVFTPDNDGVRITGTNYATLRLEESDTTDLNTTMFNSGGDFSLYTSNDARSSLTQRLNIDHATGDISFYEDTGSTAKLQWSSSDERLSLTGSDYQFKIGQGSNEPWFHRAASDGSYRIHLNGTGDIVTFNGSGVGIGTTDLHSWHAAFDGRIRVGARGCVATTTASTQIGHNWYYDGAFKYIGADYASRMVQAVGDVYWETAASGSADGSITFAERFRIANNGDLTGTDTSIASNSDERLKENISSYTYDIAKFKQYEPKTFDWKNPEAHNGRSVNRGFLAQDVQSIDARWVGQATISKDSPDYDIISDNISLTSKLGDKDAMYISVIQQLISRIEALEKG